MVRSFFCIKWEKPLPFKKSPLTNPNIFSAEVISWGTLALQRRRDEHPADRVIKMTNMKMKIL